MERPAPVLHPISETLRRRWSPYQFSDRPVETQKLHSIMEAGRWAASSFNEQPWRYIIAQKTNAPEFAKLLGCLMEANQAWAKYAPVLMLGFAKKTFSHNGTANRIAIHDLGASSAQITSEAMNQGLFVHQMGGIEVDKIRATYNVPDDFEPISAIAIGYAAPNPELPEGYRKRDEGTRQRRSLNDLFFADDWNNPSPLTK